MKTKNTKPITIDLKGEAGKRVVLASINRVISQHNKAIKALANK